MTDFPFMSGTGMNWPEPYQPPTHAPEPEHETPEVETAVGPAHSVDPRDPRATLPHEFVGSDGFCGFCGHRVDAEQHQPRAYGEAAEPSDPSGFMGEPHLLAIERTALRRAVEAAEGKLFVQQGEQYLAASGWAAIAQAAAAVRAANYESGAKWNPHIRHWEKP